MGLDAETHANAEPDEDGSEEDAGREFGPYKTVCLLGRGGMGSVYLAEQQRPIRRQVALKVIKPGMDSREVIARFESERQALALMDHPNIARVFDAGTTHNGRPYFAMEYVAGIPITEYCDRNRLTNRERLELFIPVCQAVQHAHQKGTIHRDLKPSNVLVTVKDGIPVPKVIDFGVAKAINQKLIDQTLVTGHGILIGTPEYMSPEQAASSGEDIDTRTDVYSLGIIFYELLAGAPPLDLRKIALEEFLRRLRETEPPKPSTRIRTQDPAQSTELARRRHTEPLALARQVQGDLDSIALKALEKDRSRRYGSPSDFAADIERYLRNEAVLAVPPSATYRARKFMRRHRAGVTAAAAFMLLLAGGIVATTREADIARAEKIQAEEQARAAKRARAAAELQTRKATEETARAEKEAAEAERQQLSAERRLAQIQKVAGDAVRAYAARTTVELPPDVAALIAEITRDSLSSLERERLLEPKLVPTLDDATIDVHGFELERDASQHVPAGWWATSNDPGQYRVGIDTSLMYDGKPTLFLRSLVAHPSGSVQVRQEFGAGAYRGTRVRLAVSFRSDRPVDLNPTSTLMPIRDGLVGLRRNLLHLALIVDNQAELGRFSGSGPWRQYEVVEDIPAEADGLGFVIQFSGGGTVWISRITFVSVPSSVPLTPPRARLLPRATLADAPKNLDFTAPK
jgi:hypothetical protein